MDKEKLDDIRVKIMMVDTDIMEWLCTFARSKSIKKEGKDEYEDFLHSVDVAKALDEIVKRTLTILFRGVEEIKDLNEIEELKNELKEYYYEELKGDKSG